MLLIKLQRSPPILTTCKPAKFHHNSNLDLKCHVWDFRLFVLHIADVGTYHTLRSRKWYILCESPLQGQHFPCLQHVQYICVFEGLLPAWVMQKQWYFTFIQQHFVQSLIPSSPKSCLFGDDPNFPVAGSFHLRVVRLSSRTIDNLMYLKSWKKNKCQKVQWRLMLTRKIAALRAAFF